MSQNKVVVTEYLRIDLDSEQWECRNCGGELISARQHYKRGLLVYDRDPREIHKPRLNPDLYEYTFAPDPKWCRILEYYCRHCGSMVETEYTVPGHPPIIDFEIDLDELKRRASEFVGKTGVQEADRRLPVPDPRREMGHSHTHGEACAHDHKHG